MCVREETGIKGGGGRGGRGGVRVRVCVRGEGRRGGKESMERRVRGGCNVCVLQWGVLQVCGVWCVVCGAGADVRFDSCVCPYAPVRCT